MKKSNVVKCLPVLVLAFGLAACGKDAAVKSSGPAAAEVNAASLSASIEADCGADTAAASTTSAFDLGSCQLNGQQKNLLAQVAPLKVEADCQKQVVRIVKKDSPAEVFGESMIGQGGAFSAPLTIGSSFSELDGCPVTLTGTASGIVTCSDDKKVTAVELHTEFTFAQPGIESAPAASIAMLLEDPTQQGKNPAPKAAPAPVIVNNDHHQDKGKAAPTPVIVSNDNHQDKGKAAPAPVIVNNDHHQDKGKAAPVVVSNDNHQDKGKTPAPKGSQSKMGDTSTPGSRVTSCSKFDACSLNSKASLSCSR